MDKETLDQLTSMRTDIFGAIEQLGTKVDSLKDDIKRDISVHGENIVELRTNLNNHIANETTSIEKLGKRLGKVEGIVGAEQEINEIEKIKNRPKDTLDLIDKIGKAILALLIIGGFIYVIFVKPMNDYKKGETHEEIRK